MKKKNLMFIFTLFLLSIFLLERVGALTITGNISSQSSGNPPPGHNNGVVEMTSMEDLTRPSTSFVGLLASLIEYQTTNGPEEKVLKKIFYTTASTGPFRINFEAESYFKYGNYKDYFTTSEGYIEACGNKDYHNRKIEHFYINVMYGEPSRSPSLIGVQEDSSYSFTQGEIVNFIYGTLLEGIIDEYVNSSPHTVMGYQIDDQMFDKYYIKYEPVFRTFPPLAEENDSYDGGYGPNDDLKVEAADPLDSPIIDPEVQNYLEFIEQFPYMNDEFNRKQECGHTHEDIVHESVRVDVDADEDSCSYNWDSEGCYYMDSQKKTVEGTSMACYVYATLEFKAFEYDNVRSTMSTVREGYTNEVNKTSSLYSTYSENEHESINEETGLVNEGKSDYYVGTTPNNAMAISNKGDHKYDSNLHLYQLVESGTETYSSKKTLGMGLFNLSEIMDKDTDCTQPDPRCTPCSEVCKQYISDKSSTGFLRCAQSFCDSRIKFSSTIYATDIKRNCMLNTCGYVPKTPIDCDNQVDYTIESEAASDGTDGKTISNSSCGYTGANHTEENKTVDKQRGSYYYCQRMGNGVKTTDSKGKTYYTYGVSNTTDSYINIECKENVGFDFKDLSSLLLQPGMGYEFSTYMDGNKTCRIFFDTVSWEFDFASTHSYDSIRKKLLLQKVNAFNLLASNKSGNIQVNGTELLGRVIDQEGTTRKLTLEDVEDSLIKLSALSFNISDEKSSSKSKVTEFVNNRADTSGNTVYDEGSRFNLEIIDRSNPTSYNSKIYQNGLNLYHDYILEEHRQLNEEGTRNINEYTVDGNGYITYQLPKLCVATDNRRTLKRTLDSSCDGLGAIFNVSVPKRQYYTSFKAKPSETLNNMNNKVSVKKSYFNDTVSETDEYLKGEDTCYYNVTPDGPIPEETGITCEIAYEKAATCYKSNDTYISTDPNVTAHLIVHNDTDDTIDIDSQKIELVGSNISSEISITFPAKELRTITSASGKIKSDSKVKVLGTITAHSNDPAVTLTSPTITCEKDLNVIKSSSSCTISKDGTSYWVTPNGSGEVFATMTSQKDADGNLIMKELTHKENGKYLYQVITDSADEAVIAMVKNGSSVSYCTYIPDNCPTIKACVEEFDPIETYDISNYCSTDYEIDKYHYDSPEACYDDCTTKCPDCPPGKKYCVKVLTAKQREDFKEVDTFCKGSDSAQEYDDCMNDCLNINPPGSSPYIYRSINLNNPFPSSSFSGNNGYQTGKRAVGQEWQIHYNKIAEDKEQVMKGEEPEYVIELDVAKINAIRSDTNNRNEGLEAGSIYSDTTNLPKIASCTSTGYTGYCSGFIHEDFTNYFKVVMGHAN